MCPALSAATLPTVVLIEFHFSDTVVLILSTVFETDVLISFHLLETAVLMLSTVLETPSLIAFHLFVTAVLIFSTVLETASLIAFHFSETTVLILSMVLEIASFMLLNTSLTLSTAAVTQPTMASQTSLVLALISSQCWTQRTIAATRAAIPATTAAMMPITGADTTAVTAITVLYIPSAVDTAEMATAIPATIVAMVETSVQLSAIQPITVPIASPTPESASLMDGRYLSATSWMCGASSAITSAASSERAVSTGCTASPSFAIDSVILAFASF